MANFHENNSEHNCKHHGHSHAPKNFSRAFAIGVVLNSVFVVVEVSYGVLADSLALIADAGHNLSDVLGLILAWGALTLARRSPSERRTYGMRRTSVLAALCNAIFLLVSVGAIAWEALGRLNSPVPVATETVIIVALIGIIINTGTALMFMSGRKEDLNIRGAFLHMAADAAISAGVVVAGLVIAVTGWFWIDPLMSLAIVLIIVIGTWGLLRESVNLVLDAVPAGISTRGVREYLVSVSGVEDVHHLHIWALSTTEVALTVHIVLAETKSADMLLVEINRGLKERFNIGHATIQFESQSYANCPDGDCTRGHRD